MQTIVQPRTLSPEDFLVYERTATEKHEFIDGEVINMSGTSYFHDLVLVNLMRHLLPLLATTHHFHTANLRVFIPIRKTYFYPDAAISIGNPAFHDRLKDVLLNPSIVFEILSPSTELYDRTVKFEHYKSIGSLQQYVLIAQEDMRVESYVRLNETQWRYESLAVADSQLELPGVQLNVPVANLYKGIEFPLLPAV